MSVVDASKHSLGDFWTTGFGGSPLMGGIASAAGSLFDNLFAGSRIRKQLKANKELAQYQFDLNKQQWEAENEYNSPVAQMQRLKEAGLNPNLVYGNGSVSGNTTTAGPRYEAPKAERNMERMSGLLSFFSAYQDLRAKKAQADNLEMAAREHHEKAVWQNYFNRVRSDWEPTYRSLLENDAAIKEYDANTARWRSILAEDSYPYQIEALKISNRLARWNVANARRDNILKEDTHRRNAVELAIRQKDLNNYCLFKILDYGMQVFDTLPKGLFDLKSFLRSYPKK